MQPRSLLKLILLCGGVWLTSHAVMDQVRYFLELAVFHWLLAYAATWGAAIIALVYIAFNPFALLRVIVAVVLCLATLLGETYFLVTGNWLMIEAVEAMWLPAMFRFDTVTFYAHQFGYAALKTLPLLLGLLIPPPHDQVPRVNPPWVQWLRWQPLALLPLLPCLMIAAIIVHDAGPASMDTRALPPGFYAFTLMALYPAGKTPAVTMGEVDLPLVQSAAARRIVMIVDESISGDFIDVNVPRDTTPYLLTYPDGMMNFGLATAGSTCSNFSNAMLRLGVKPTALGDGAYSLFANPSIWKYAREAGFETHFIDAQGLLSRGENFMNSQEIALIDQVHALPAGTKGRDADQEAARILARLLEKPQMQFIYLNKYGTHFPYQRLAGDGPPRFDPVMARHEPIGDHERLINSYQNAIFRMVDQFFAALLPAIDLTDTVVIYTSDHGQNLLDDGKPVTHCRHLGTSPFEALVPLFVWAGANTPQREFQQAASVNFGAASHFEIFPTLLDLFGYDPAAVRERYHQSLFEPIAEPMGYLSGPVSGRFGLRPAWNLRGDLTSLKR